MYIKVRVIAGAPKEVIQKNEDDVIEMYLREPAERNLANKRVLEVIRKMYPDQAVRMIKGHHSPSKIIQLGTAE